MFKTRVVEIVPNPEGGPPAENPLGYTFLPVPPMNKPPVASSADGRMPPPPMVSVNGNRFYCIGYSYDIITGDDDDSIPTSDYVLIVQAVPKPSPIIRAGPEAMSQVRAIVPEPRGIN